MSTYLRTYTNFMDEEDADMKEEKNPQTTDGTGQEEVFRCMTCGAIIGYYEPGSAGTTKCPSCKEDFRLEFREGIPTLKRIRRRAKAAT